MRVAIIHYWLFHMRGGEKVLEALCELFPQADIFTHVYDPANVSQTITSHRVQTTFIQRLPFARRLYKKYLSLMPMALEEIDLRGYDLVISSESGPAKGVIPPPDAYHLCYCHSPMRYVWDQYHVYRESAGALSRASMPLLIHPLRVWDVTSAARVDQFVANSNSIKERIKKYWRRPAMVVPPPVEIERFRLSKEVGDFYLYVGEAVPYKRLDLAIEACNTLGRRLVVIGGGPDMRRMRALAGPTIEFLGHAPPHILRDYYAHCRALLFPGEEDFGIVPVEAMASGRPVLAFGRGGALDTVVDGETGMLFHEQSVEALSRAIEDFEAVGDRAFDPARLRAHASQFSRHAFKNRIAAIVDDAIGVRTQKRERSSGLSVPRRKGLPAPAVLQITSRQEASAPKRQ
ncbi:MAG: glycosyltransferase [Alphaproteobacteria bacterium]